MKKRKYTGNLTIITRFRVSPDDHQMLKMLAKERGQSRSEFLRDIIKVLAVQQQEKKGNVQ